MGCGAQLWKLCCSVLSPILMYCISLVVHREEKMKENIPTIACKLHNVPINHGSDGVLSVSAEHQVHANCVPPLMYPPRNYVDLIKDAQCARRRRDRGKTFSRPSLEI